MKVAVSEKNCPSNSDLIDSEYNHFSKVCVENKNCYGTDRIDVERLFTPFRVRLKPDGKLQKTKTYQNS